MRHEGPHCQAAAAGDPRPQPGVEGGSTEATSAGAGKFSSPPPPGSMRDGQLLLTLEGRAALGDLGRRWRARRELEGGASGRRGRTRRLRRRCVRVPNWLPIIRWRGPQEHVAW